MSKRDPRGPLLDMREFARIAQRLAKGRSATDLEHDVALRLALERAVEVIGEAANRLPKDFRENHAEIEWAKIIGMRNVLSHGYDQIDSMILWEVASLQLADLISQLDDLLR